MTLKNLDITIAPEIGSGGIARVISWQYGSQAGRPSAIPHIYLDAASDAAAAAAAEAAAAAAAKAAADAAAKAAADAVAKAASDKAAADAATAAKAESDRIAAELAAKKITDKEAELLREVMDKKQKLKDAEEKLKAFDGIDPTLFVTLKAAADKAAADKLEAERKAAEKSGDFERLKAMMAEEHKKEVATIKADAEKTANTLNGALKTINDLTVGAAFSNSQFITKELVLTPTVTKTVFESHFDVEDGRVIAYDKPRGATARTKLIDGSGNPIGFEDAMKKLVETNPERDKMLRSKLGIGAGSRTDNNSGNRTEDNQGQLKGIGIIAAALARGALAKQAK